MRIFRQTLNKALKSLGYQLIAARDLKRLSDLASFAKADNSLSRHLREVLSLHEIDCVFDVGANDGQFATYLREEAGYSGWIVSFEPLPDLAAELEIRSGNDDRWKILPLALSSQTEKAVLRRTAESVFSSLHPSSEEQPEKYWEANQTIETLSIETRALDELWPDLKNELGVSRLLLKMDTQGHDLAVFAGARESLGDIPALLSELSFLRIYDDSHTYSEALSVFEKFGYVPSVFSPVSFGEGHAAIEMDGLFVRAPK